MHDRIARTAFGASAPWNLMVATFALGFVLGIKRPESSNAERQLSSLPLARAGWRPPKTSSTPGWTR